MKTARWLGINKWGDIKIAKTKESIYDTSYIPLKLTIEIPDSYWINKEFIANVILPEQIPENVDVETIDVNINYSNNKTNIKSDIENEGLENI